VNPKIRENKQLKKRTFFRASPAKENSSSASAEGASRNFLKFDFQIKENKLEMH